MQDSWDELKPKVATAPLDEALAISISVLRSGVVPALRALQMMNQIHQEADQVRLREIATTNLEGTTQVIDELFVDIIGQRLKQK